MKIDQKKVCVYKICFVYIILTRKNFEKLAREKLLAGNKLTHDDWQDEQGPEEDEMTRKTNQKCQKQR